MKLLLHDVVNEQSLMLIKESLTTYGVHKYLRCQQSTVGLIYHQVFNTEEDAVDCYVLQLEKALEVQTYKNAPTKRGLKNVVAFGKTKH